MDFSRMMERLLKLAVSTVQAFPSSSHISVCCDDHVALTSYPMTSPSASYLLSSPRSPTISYGWYSSTGSSTLAWTLLRSFCSLETESSTKTGGEYGWQHNTTRDVTGVPIIPVSFRNSETVTYFWANWNIPVHKWCLRWALKARVTMCTFSVFVCF